MLRKTARTLWLLPREITIFLITIYQRTLSPDHGLLKMFYPYGFCRHHPTCSAYGKDLIEERGLILGTLFMFRRLLSCHPWKKPSNERVRSIIERE